MLGIQLNIKLPKPANIAMTGLLLSAIVAFALQSQWLLAAYMLIALVVLMVNIKQLGNMDGKVRIFSLILIFLLTVILPVSVFRDATALAHYAVVLVSLGVAYVITRDPEMYLSASRWSLIAVQLTIIIYLYFVGLDNFPLENMLPDSSSNGVTSYLILLQVNYSIVNFVLRRKTGIATAFITLGICVIGYGRGSILAAVGIVFLCVVFSLPQKSLPFKIVYLLSIFGVGIGATLAFGEDIIGFIDSNTKLGSGLFDMARAQMTMDYVRQIDGVSFLIGADYEGTSIAQEYNNNPHSAYIRAHHIFGFFYLLLMLLMPAAIMWKGHVLSIKLFAGLMLVLLLFRSATEPLLFPTVFDLFYFSICLVLARRFPDVALRRQRTALS